MIPIYTDAQKWAHEFTRAEALETRAAALEARAEDLEREVERLKAESRQAQTHFAVLREVSKHALHWLPLLEKDCDRLRRELDDERGVIR